MDTIEKVPQRKRNRAPNFNYNSNGVYFLTICTLNREHVLGRIVGTDDLGGPSVSYSNLGGPSAPHSDTGREDFKPYVVLSECRKIVEYNLIETAKHYSEIRIDKYVIMPNHVHVLISIDDCDCPFNDAPKGNVQTNKVSKFVTAFKKFSNKQIGKNIWQNRFHDHIIRNKEDYSKHYQYIEENPVKWLLSEDEYY